MCLVARFVAIELDIIEFIVQWHGQAHSPAAAINARAKQTDRLQFEIRMLAFAFAFTGDCSEGKALKLYM